MKEDEMLMCLIAFVIGYLVARMMRGNGLSVGGIVDNHVDQKLTKNHTYRNFVDMTELRHDYIIQYKSKCSKKIDSVENMTDECKDELFNFCTERNNDGVIVPSKHGKGSHQTFPCDVSLISQTAQFAAEDAKKEKEAAHLETCRKIAICNRDFPNIAAVLDR